MDHIEESHKSNQPPDRQPVIRDRDEADQSDYYYDDATNYEIYRDESDEADEDEAES